MSSAYLSWCQPSLLLEVLSSCLHLSDFVLWSGGEDPGRSDGNQWCHKLREEEGVGGGVPEKVPEEVTFARGCDRGVDFSRLLDTLEVGREWGSLVAPAGRLQQCNPGHVVGEAPLTWTVRLDEARCAHVP